MKIFDASQLIAIFNQFQYPQTFDVILQLGHELAIPRFVWDELKDDRTRTNAQRLIDEGKLTKLEKNSAQEIEKFQLDAHELKKGEVDVILTYKKLGGYKNNVYCILDDKDAQQVASRLGIRCIDLQGLLKMLGNKGVKYPKKIDEIIELLDRSEFRPI